MSWTRILLAGLCAVVASALLMHFGITSTQFQNPACACVTWNEMMISYLDSTEYLIQQYAAGHDGLYPTYQELQALLVEEYPSRHLTNQVDIVTRTFTFNPAQAEVGTMGYVVSSDRKDYVLLGIGLIETHTQFSLFDQNLGQRTSYEFPILRPGDIPTLPDPSDRLASPGEP